MIEKTYKIISKTGIQARPAAQLVNLASQFDSDIFLEYKSKKVNLKSIMGVMSLAVGQGAEIIITAHGQSEQEAIRSIDDFIRSGIAE